MELYREYPAWLIFLRRTYAVAAGVLALPFMLFLEISRPPFYFYLHRVWSKTSDKPVGWIRPKRQLVIFIDCWSLNTFEAASGNAGGFVSGRCSEEYLDIVIPIETYIHEIYINIFLIVLI